MSILKPIAIPATAVAVVAASLYLGLTAFSLFATVPESSANTAPEGSLRELDLDVGDSSRNWDFNSDENRIDNVDWACVSFSRGRT